MKREELLKIATDFVSQSYFNNIGPQSPDAEGYFGLRVFDDPIMGIVPADDPYWKELLKPEAIGPQCMLPNQWLESAKSVVCFFLPISRQIKAYGAMSFTDIRKEWLFARTDAHWVIMSMCEYAADQLKAQGFDYIIPQNDPRYLVRSGAWHEPNEMYIAEEALAENDVYKDYKLVVKKEKAKSSFPVYNSNWSERHIGYTCGLGTFGLGANIITRVGTAGRLVSFVTDWVPETYDTRPYTGIYEYCTRCGACIKRCPSGSISLEGGKDKQRCHKYWESIGFAHVPRYHCGTCMAGVPCQDGIPGRKKLPDVSSRSLE